VRRDAADDEVLAGLVERVREVDRRDSDGQATVGILDERERRRIRFDVARADPRFVHRHLVEAVDVALDRVAGRDGNRLR